MANSVNPDQIAPIGAVFSGYTLFASTLNLSVMLGNYLQQTTSSDDIFRCIFFLALIGLTYQSTAMVILRRSVTPTTHFLLGKLRLSGSPVLSAHTFPCN